LALFLHLAILHPQTNLPGSDVVRKAQELQRESFPAVLQIVDLLLFQEEMVVNFIVPEVNFLPFSLSLSIFLSSANLFTQHFLSSSLFFQPSNL